MCRVGGESRSDLEPALTPHLWTAVLSARACLYRRSPATQSAQVSSSPTFEFLYRMSRTLWIELQVTKVTFLQVLKVTKLWIYLFFNSDTNLKQAAKKCENNVRISFTNCISRWQVIHYLHCIFPFTFVFRWHNYSYFCRLSAVIIIKCLNYIVEIYLLQTPRETKKSSLCCLITITKN